MTKRAQEVLDFNLYLGPDDVWRVVPEPCATEKDCTHMPWCRINGACQRQQQFVKDSPEGKR